MCSYSNLMMEDDDWTPAEPALRRPATLDSKLLPAVQFDFMTAGGCLQFNCASTTSTAPNSTLSTLTRTTSLSAPHSSNSGGLLQLSTSGGSPTASGVGSGVAPSVLQPQPQTLASQPSWNSNGVPVTFATRQQSGVRKPRVEGQKKRVSGLP